jgi:hypothetical protein
MPRTAIFTAAVLVTLAVPRAALAEPVGAAPVARLSLDGILARFVRTPDAGSPPICPDAPSPVQVAAPPGHPMASGASYVAGGALLATGLTLYLAVSRTAEITAIPRFGGMTLRAVW